MKKITLLVVAALMSFSMTWAQDNLALGGTATASAGNAAAAIDGNDGTRWECTADNDPDNSWWQVELTKEETFNTIQILWEGAYAKSFTISVSTDGTDYRTIVTETDKVLTGFPNLQTYKFDAVTARYVKFQTVARGTQWGVSFYEFRIFDMADDVLSGVRLTADKSVVKIGESVNLTATGVNQLGNDMDAGTVTYEVTPAAAGTVNGNVYTPAQAGVASIVAKAGDFTSSPLNVTAYAGEKINIFANYQTMVSPLPDTKTESMVGAFDDNMGSVWDLGNTGGDKGQDYTVGFDIDFASLYDITAVSVTFEGACPADYQIIAVTNDGTETVLQDVKNHAGMATFTEFSIANAKDTRYIKFISTKAATGYGIKIFDFSVYGENMQTLPDTQAPTDFTASVVEGGEGPNSITLALKATDDVSSLITYEIAYTPAGSEDAKTVVTTGKNGETTNYILSGLESNTQYAISVTAKDAKGNAAENIIQLTAKTKELTAAPVPTVPAADVMSIFSETYGNAAALNTNPDWGQATISTVIKIDGNETGSLANLNYQGYEFAPMNVEGMEFFHIDVYPVNCTSMSIVPIYKKSETGANDTEKPYAMTLNANEWNQINIPVTAFATGTREGDWVYQVKFDNGNGNNFYVDNIYYFKNSIEDSEAPTWVSALVSDVKDTEAILTLKAADNNDLGMLTYTVKNGDDVLATAKGKAGEETNVTVKGLTPETSYTLNVTVVDAAGNVAAETKTLSFTTVAEITVPTSGEGEIIVQNDVIKDPQTLKYSWAFTQDSNKVTLTVTVLNPNDITGLVATPNYQNWTSGGLDEEKSGESYEWTNCTAGQVLKAKVWWPLAGGRAETPEFTYTVLTEGSGIDGIDADNNAPAVYYNLSGVQVANPATGLYIKVQGNKVSKVIIK